MNDTIFSPVLANIPLESHPSAHSPVKRLIDLIGSLAGLLILVILFLPIAIAIRVDSPGPVLFTQVRCGLLGKPFRIIKFRTMYLDAERRKMSIYNQVSGPFFKNVNDPRITKVGRFLRRTSLDELPQFCNVFRGEMSLVGTRPPTLDEVAQYDRLAWQRLRVKTGMTGEWQVSRRSQVSSFDEVLNLDLKYQRNWSWQYDLLLILRTILVLFSKNNGAC